MFRKAFLTIALVAFTLGTVIGCTKPVSETKPSEKPVEQAPASVTE